jgi:hypothetical protein
MTEVKHPSKDRVRQYLARRARDSRPPPSPEEIRRELGWDLIVPRYSMSTGRAR